MCDLAPAEDRRGGPRLSPTDEPHSVSYRGYAAWQPWAKVSNQGAVLAHLNPCDKLGAPDPKPLAEDIRDALLKAAERCIANQDHSPGDSERARSVPICFEKAPGTGAERYLVTTFGWVSCT